MPSTTRWSKELERFIILRMKYQSLSDFLDPDDHSKTIEGLPAPMRAVISTGGAMASW